MPRPTAAQLVYGTLTVIFSALAMLLLSGATSGPGVAVVAVAALLLGLLVALRAPAPKRASSVVASSVPAPAPEPVREPTRLNS
ncbi:hypothetical protein [Streptomyces sp. NPDC006610]|jgi:hypothetical protein|uniref:hypothetical protein n=1 Tax=Streptomyces sp. NPDC006610 TaxID=3154584 RepID=UPI0033A52423